MREHNANIWPLDGVRPWHTLTAICRGCGHREALRVPELRARHPECVYLYEVEAWLVCTLCGNREHNRIEMGKLPRDH